jgi:hypothetical protein
MTIRSGFVLAILAVLPSLIACAGEETDATEDDIVTDAATLAMVDAAQTRAYMNVRGTAMGSDLVKALGAAAKRGADVRVLFAAPKYDSKVWQSQQALEGNGVDVDVLGDIAIPTLRLVADNAALVDRQQQRQRTKHGSPWWTALRSRSARC